MKKLLLLPLLLLTTLLAGCAYDADIASTNLSREADMFRIMRRIVFYNGITGDYMLSIEWLCSLGNNDPLKQLSVTCKTGDSSYKKHFLGLSDNVTYFVEQVDWALVSTNHYKVVFKPSVILPIIEVDL